MKENVLDVLVYLFQSNLEQDNQTHQAAHSDRDSIQIRLLEAGFPLTGILKAFAWIDGMAHRQSAGLIPVDDRSIRIYSDWELQYLDLACRSLLLNLEQSGILSPSSRELVLDRVMALENQDLDAEDLKWIVLMVLFNQPGQEDAYVWMEALVFDNPTAHLN